MVVDRSLRRSLKDWGRAALPLWYAWGSGLLMDLFALVQFIVDRSQDWSGLPGIRIHPLGWICVSLVLFLVSSFWAYHRLRVERDGLRPLRPSIAVEIEQRAYQHGTSRYVLTVSNNGASAICTAYLHLLSADGGIFTRHNLLWDLAKELQAVIPMSGHDRLTIAEHQIVAAVDPVSFAYELIVCDDRTGQRRSV